MYIASKDIKKIHASSGLKNLRFSKYFDDVTRVWSNLKDERHGLRNERKKEQAHKPYAPTLLENAAHYAYHHNERWYWSIR